MELTKRPDVQRQNETYLAMEKRLFVHKNEAGSVAKVVTVGETDSLSSLRAICSKKLGIKATIIFNASGAEVKTMAELANNEALYVSSGEKFYRFRSAKGPESFNISVLGTGGVGKSAITLRFVRDYFIDDWDPTIEDAYRKTIDVDGQLSVLEILDTAGQDDFESLRPQWMDDRDAYVFVYSMNSKKSLRALEPFFELYQQINANRRPMPPIVLVANKKDLDAQVSSEDGRKAAEIFRATYVETSALTGENITKVFESVVQQIRRTQQTKPPRRRAMPCLIL
ncbi:unnamed protein product [Aphanomyces euteiches]|uniref:KHA domain-containing protein n=1 Tax=Aphanomyces euteiches TaxID=100861 RepID=A0A6G0WCX3_9STRA|nr:hypothetical protein Ae201684_016793 [Aphanomyces euteiches]KAH9076148.1 hypothetical protein Ae201684P_012636 [Aphanomyces euteiches]KAH9156157.1 hypothetical protein AeRB84_001914 [Aphanomyces euteiches]